MTSAAFRIRLSRTGEAAPPHSGGFHENSLILGNRAVRTTKVRVRR